jgi:ferredoxin-NADP reductase
MAAVLKARVIKTEKIHGDTVYVNCKMVEPYPLGFKGGQYIIVNSGKLLANGKLGKRAYSIAAPDRDQHHFALAVKKVADGVGSGFIHGLKPGDTFEFSGPWGKYQMTDINQNEQFCCIATDTGITAALGLLRGEAAAPFLGRSKLIWFLSSLDYFIPIDQVRSWLPEDISVDIVSPCPTVDERSRGIFIEEAVSRILQGTTFTKIYLSGDGLVLRHLKSAFLKSGAYQPEQIMMESFFHHESLKTAVV